jgi:hypothetical protein
VVSATDPYGRILDFLDSFKVKLSPQLALEAYRVVRC